MKFTATVVAALLVSGAACAQHFDVAVTVDDLPAHGELPPGMTRLGIAETTLQVFRQHGVKQAYGFVNAGKLDNAPDDARVLDAWRAAGQPLGNHTATHMGLSQAPSLAAWQADVIAGEAAVAQRMQGQDWHYLRLPYLDGGDRFAAAMAFLRARGYRLADVSLSFDDWAYADAYARCVTRGDQATIAAMKTQYLAAVDRSIAGMKADSQRVYGRVIPQVLLTHLGGWSAVTLPDVLQRLDRAGARYVTLQQAQADPAYAEPQGGTVIDRTAHGRGIRLDVQPPPEGSLDLQRVCR
ncbi:hypothetical protein ASF61_05820 [Duganella sp. Leaf126]|uniref:polysaccharide deacetylase family protein n=1 Tax=Duganella sp. Leaf126 TaxID=1736266 RepID=UPI0006F1F9FA|nr:polysaccharide deacetylase family protein [Duganella sp. Leaf126]KQQ40291.1 hypothetical protein ASF61_05820 [Duganella sp. Leaf126]